MLIYIAGKYSGDIDNNIADARKVAIDLWEMGHAVICPHLNSSHMEQDCQATWEDYLRGDLNIISRVDALVMLEYWQASKGATMEHEYAKSLNIPIYYVPEYPPLHPTEINSPIQCQAFREEVGRMYRTHLAKNADYSPANILATGEIGVVTRLWDKTARLMNLVGIHFKSVVHEGVFPPKQPKNESINDTLEDLAVYAVIGKLLRTDRWGK